MEQLNYVKIRGRVGNVRVNNVGERAVCHFSVATNIIYRNSDSVATEEVTWHACNLWSSRKCPDVNVVKVGAPVEIEGRFRTNKYTGSDGVEHYSSEILVNELKLLPENEQLTAATAL